MNFQGKSNNNMAQNVGNIIVHNFHSKNIIMLSALN
jgi:hypothetical protein